MATIKHRLTPFQHGLLRGAAQNGGTVPPWLYRSLKPRARRSFDILATRGYFARDGEGGLFLTETGKAAGERGYTWIKGNSERGQPDNGRDTESYTDDGDRREYGVQ